MMKLLNCSSHITANCALFILTVFLLLVACTDDTSSLLHDYDQNEQLHPLLNEGLILKGLDPADFVFDEESLMLDDGTTQISAEDLLYDLGLQEMDESFIHKVATAQPNNTMLGGQAPLRCVGCTQSGGQNNCNAEESYRINLYYSFDSNYPSAYRQEMRDALAVFESATNGKLIFNETNSNPQITIQTTNDANSSAQLPGIDGIAGGPVKIRALFFSPQFDTRRRNEILHEIGHVIGFRHSHAEDFAGSTYSTGTGVIKLVSIMSFDHYVNTPNDYISMGTLPSNDLTALSKLYPYNGGGNSCDNRTVNPQPISFQPESLSDLSGIWTLMDVSDNDVVSVLDRVLVIRHLLGIESLPQDVAERAGWIDGNNPNLTTQDLVHITREIMGDPIHSFPTEGHVKIMYDFDNDGVFNYDLEYTALENVFPNVLISSPFAGSFVTIPAPATDWKENDLLIRCEDLSRRELADYIGQYNANHSVNPDLFPLGISNSIFRDLNKIRSAYGSIIQ